MNLNESVATKRTVKARFYDTSGNGLTLSHTFSAGDLKIVQPDGTTSNTVNLPVASGAAAAGSFDIVLDQTELQQVGEIRLQLNTSGVLYWEWVEPVDYASVLSNDSHWANIDTTISSRAAATAVAAIPTNPLLTSDSRLNNLDASISTRATATGVAAIPTNPLLTSDSRLNNLDAQVSTRATQASVNLLPSAGSIVTALLTAVLGNDGVRNRTVQGVLRRLDWMLTSRATGLLSAIATFFQYDGTTGGVVIPQDTTSGNRTASTTVSGD